MLVVEVSAKICEKKNEWVGEKRMNLKLHHAFIFFFIIYSNHGHLIVLSLRFNDPFYW